MISPFTNTNDDASVEERVNDCYRALTLIHAACNVHEDASFDQWEILESVGNLAGSAAQLLEPLRRAPAAVANWRPPSEDEEGGAR